MKVAFRIGDTAQVRLSHAGTRAGSDAANRAPLLDPNALLTTQALTCYKQMLTYIKSAVTRNYSEKSINAILDVISSSTDTEFLEEFYSTTLQALEAIQNEVRRPAPTTGAAHTGLTSFPATAPWPRHPAQRLWFKTNLKLAKLWLDRGEYGRLSKILKPLHKACQTESGEDDTKKGTQLLEIYALEIQMHTALRNNKRLKELYLQSLRIKSAIPHPRIMGVIRECGGKMHMMEGTTRAHGA